MSKHIAGNPPAPRNSYEAEDFKDAERVLKWLSGADMSREKQWIEESKNIPCAWYAIDILAPQKRNQQRCESSHFRNV